MQKIVLIVGASGVGKDSLLKIIKSKIDANFVKRYITRIPDENESNYFIDEEAFTILKTTIILYHRGMHMETLMQ